MKDIYTFKFWKHKYGPMPNAWCLVPDAKWMGEALWINNSNRSKSDELVKEWWKQ